MHPQSERRAPLEGCHSNSEIHSAVWPSICISGALTLRFGISRLRERLPLTIAPLLTFTSGLVTAAYVK
jgi:hypothetical protein